MKKAFFLSVAVCAGLVAGMANAQQKNTEKGKQKKAVAPPVAGKKVVQKDTTATHAVVKHKKTRKPAATQTEETIELQRQDTKMVVEVRNGGVYVDGDLVSTIGDAKKESHRIVINVKEDPKQDEEKEVRHDAKPAVDIEYTRKAMLGVYTDPLNENGAKVTSVMRNSPADVAGLYPGDVITQVNGRIIDNTKDLNEAIADHDGGETVTITYYRADQKIVADAVLVDVIAHRRHETYEYQAPDLHGDRRIHAPFYNSYMFNYVDNSFEYAPQMGIRAESAKNGRGVAIIEVREHSPADLAGLKKGDVVLRVDHLRTTSVDDIQDILDDTWPNQRVQVEFKRNGVLMFAYLKFAKERVRRDL